MGTSLNKRSTAFFLNNHTAYTQTEMSRATKTFIPTTAALIAPIPAAGSTQYPSLAFSVIDVAPVDHRP